MRPRPIPSRYPTPKHSRRRFIIPGLIATIFVAYIGGSYLIVPTRSYQGDVTYKNAVIPAENASVDWPTQGQAALATTEQGIIGTYGPQSSAPIASIAKLMTALSILEEKPLGIGERGTEIILSQADIDIYNEYVAKNGSVVPVRAGNKITQYEALQAMLLPSANNIADTMAVWAFGSQEGYVEYANRFALKLGMTNSRFEDASGFNPGTQSTPADLVKLAEKVLENEVLAEIVSQETAVIQNVGEIRNTNRLLNDGDGFIGLKTGTTDEAGGCLLWAAKYNVGTKPITIIGAVMGEKDKLSVLRESSAMLLSSHAGFVERVIVEKGQPIGRYILPWGDDVEVVTEQTVSTVTWKGLPTTTRVSLNTTDGNLDRGEIVGKLLETTNLQQNGADVKSVSIVANEKSEIPGFWWRLTHPLQAWRLRFG